MGYEGVKGDQPAFPSGALSGMTYRQWLVGQALNGLLASSAGHLSHLGPHNEKTRGEVAEAAILMADKVIQKLRG